MKTKVLLTAILSLFLSACGSEAEPKKEPTKTAEYYINNEAELKAKIKECSNNPGELEKTPNCINAKQALKTKSRGTGRKDYSNTFDGIKRL